MWCSLLFVPVLERRFLARAAERGADAVVLDLEASIPPARKIDAREALPGAIDALRGRIDTLVRVNVPGAEMEADLEVAAREGVVALVLARVEDAAIVHHVDVRLSGLERGAGIEDGTIGLVPMVESARGLLAAHAIAAASPRVRALALGTEDLALDLGAPPGETLLAGPCQDLVVAARAAGRAALAVAAGIGEFRDLAAFESAARLSRALGADGGFAVHPAQVAVLNDAFRPTREELDWARRCVAAFDAALERGSGVASLDGAMIDLPVAERARAVLRRGGER